ncbi:MAG: restriction endonuclease subunit S [Byssovorax sp.]
MMQQPLAFPMSTVLSDWPVKPLGELLTFLTSGSRGWAKHYSDSGSLFLRIQNVGRNKMLLDDVAFVSEPDTAEARRTLVQPGDVLLSITADLGRTGVIPEGLGDAYINQHLAILRVAGVHPPFLSAYLASSEGQRQILGRNRQGVKAGLNFDDIRSFKVPLPPLAEQRRIAEVLDRVEALRAKRRDAIAQLTALAHAIFIDLFGYPVINDMGWSTTSLKNVGKVKTGGTPPSAKSGMFGGSIPFVTPGDLDSDDAVKRSVTEEGAAEVETVRAGSAFVCCIGTIGKMGQAMQRSAFNQQINAIEWTSAVDDVYGIYVLRFFKKQIAAQGSSTTLSILKKSLFEKIEIPVPPLALQQDFARRIAAVDKLKAAHRASLAEMDALFAALQHRAFRGEL